ncbi:MAG: transposase family protein [Firmicutes bacterium]|nr:transposase family protein [Bacillota bacterium]
MRTCYRQKARFTTRLVECIQQQALGQPFLHIAEEIGISHTIVRKIFNEFAEKKASETRLITLLVLGIDEIHVSKKPRGIL